MTDYETVDHPRHYAHPKGIECIDVIEDGNSFNLMTALKYIWRVQWGSKPGTTQLEDLKKAAWYIAREIERITKNEAAH